MPRAAQRLVSFLKARWWLALGAGLLLAALLAATLLSRASVRSDLRQVRGDFEEIDKGLAVYGVDYGGWVPPDTRLSRSAGRAIPLTFEGPPGLRFDRQTRTVSLDPMTSMAWTWPAVTTPIRYVSAEGVSDPFRQGRPYGYTSWCSFAERTRDLAVVQSPGPGGVDDFPVEKIRAALDPLLIRDDGRTGPPEVRLEDCRKVVAPYLYDPTNGLRSGGDLILVWSTQGCVGTLELHDIWFWRDGRRRGIDPPRTR